MCVCVCWVQYRSVCVGCSTCTIFCVTWLDCTSDKGDTHLRELPLFLCLKQCSAMRRKSDHFGRCEITIYHENDRQTNWEEHISNMPPYASDTFWEIGCQQRDLQEAPFIQLESVWPLKTNWVCLLVHCIYRYLLRFIYLFFCSFFKKKHLFRLICLWHWVLFFVLLTVSLVYLHPVNVLNVWAKREQKINASTAVWHFAAARLSHFEEKPKGGLLAAAPGAVRERGLMTEKREGLQGFSTIFSCY